MKRGSSEPPEKFRKLEGSNLKLEFKWEVIDAQTLRAKAPGGWLVRYQSHTGAVALTHLADPKHEWEVSIPEDVIIASREHLQRLEHDMQDPYTDAALKAEMRVELENLRRFIAEHG